MSRDDKIEYKGVVAEIKKTHYMISILYLNNAEDKENSEKEKKEYLERKHNKEEVSRAMVQGNISGKMRSNRVRITVGDYVRILVSKYDPTKGMVIFRDKTDI